MFVELSEAFQSSFHWVDKNLIEQYGVELDFQSSFHWARLRYLRRIHEKIELSILFSLSHH